MPRKTGLVWHERCMWHELGRFAGIMPAGFPVEPGQPHESAEAKRRLKNLLDASGLSDHLTPVPVRPATDTELLRVHTPAYLAKLESLNRQPAGCAGLDAYLTEGSYDIARLAAGGCLEAVDAIMDGRVENAYALVRPIGHHAEPDSGKGFCLLSNAALAAAHLLETHGVERVALIDLDVHHGNGAQAAFWKNPDILTISVHQEDWFPPASGRHEEQGEDAGFGTNINIPLPAGSGWGAYKAACTDVILPALAQFRPHFIIIPCGYDAGAQDPLGRMILGSSHYRQMIQMLLEQAETMANGRVLVTHEGGYNPYTVPFMGLAVFEALAGRQSGVTDPMDEITQTMPGHKLLAHQHEAVRKAAGLLKDLPGHQASQR